MKKDHYDLHCREPFRIWTFLRGGKSQAPGNIKSCHEMGNPGSRAVTSSESFHSSMKNSYTDPNLQRSVFIPTFSSWFISIPCRMLHPHYSVGLSRIPCIPKDIHQIIATTNPLSLIYTLLFYFMLSPLQWKIRKSTRTPTVPAVQYPER